MKIIWAAIYCLPKKPSFNTTEITPGKTASKYVIQP